MLLSVVLFAIIEFALYWKSYYTIQAMSDDIEANLASYPVADVCAQGGGTLFPSVGTSKTEYYLYRNPNFSMSEDANDVYILKTPAQIAGIPKIVVKMDCTDTSMYGAKITVYYMYKGVYLLSSGHLLKSSTSIKTPKY